MSETAPTVALSPETIDAIARRVVELQVAATTPKTADVLTLVEAMAYTKRRSRNAFIRWRKAWGVRPYQRGRYSRAQLDVALGREARRRAA